MVANENRPLKRLKMKRCDLYDILSFPASADVSGGPFRSSVQSFLGRHARSTLLFRSLQAWQILFRVGDCSPALDIVEEDVTRSPTSVYCDHCRVVGWSGHPVCRKRYHCIIRSKSSAVDGDGYEYQNHKAMSSTSMLNSSSKSRCECCNCMTTADDVENWVYHQFEDNTHLLHGVVHSNGYGHLLTVNGREGGSTVPSGLHIINFWDRLCTTLHVRKVTVMDVSKKYGMVYRLLHAIIKGHSWYGNWGYEFGSASYALTAEAYQKAVHSLSTIPLSPFLLKHRKPCNRLQDVIALYQSLSDSHLATIKDLFSFVMSLLSEDARKSSKSMTGWTRDDVDRVQQALLKVLTAAVVDDDGRWISRRALRGAVCKVASPKLLDYSINHLAGKLAAANGKVVRARCNPHSSAVEFRLELSSSSQPQPQPHGKKGLNSNSSCPSKEHLRNDLRFLYDCLLNPQTMVNYIPEHMRECMIDAATKLIDCKQFVKDYKPDRVMINNNNPFALHYWCHVELSDEYDRATEPFPPSELVVLPLDATVGDLKNEVKKCFQQVYPMFKKFQVEGLPEYGKKIEDSFTLKFLIGSTGSVRIQGKRLTRYGLSRFRMERGTESWVVDCICGAKDDDGERMLACDTCSVWQHTRCVGIHNLDEIPAQFICMKCCNSKESNGPSSGEASGVTITKTCRGDAMSTAATAFAVTFGIR